VELCRKICKTKARFLLGCPPLHLCNCAPPHPLCMG
jgi:hypothetical protein